MRKRGKLELTWVGKYDEKAIEPRILVEDEARSYGDPDSGNLLIHGDNLIALKALQQEFAGRVKCVFIDPPYNTNSAFEYYDDDLEHSQWLNIMRPRLQLLRALLRDDGFLCCEADDSEGQYLKVLLDEIFGRSNYLTTIYVRVRYPDKTLKEDMAFHKEIEQIHVYRKSDAAVPNLDCVEAGFDKFIFRITETGAPAKTLLLGGKKVEVFPKGSYEIEKMEEGSPKGLKEIWATGTILDGNSSGRFFRDCLTGRYQEDGYGVMYKVYGIGDDAFDFRYFTGPKRVGATKGKYYQGVPKEKLARGTMQKKLPIYGFYDFAASFGNCRQEGQAAFRGGKKPEKLVQLFLHHFSNVGDIVVDSFLGSGTTAAVAHKMKRRYIGIEMGDHCYSLCKPRLDRVIQGDQSGISKDVGWSWNGGGGYRFYELAPSLLVKGGKLPVYRVNPAYTFEMVCEAICKIEGFRYAPQGVFHGRSTERRFLHVARAFVNAAYVKSVAAQLGEGQSLLIYAAKIQSGMRLPPFIEVRRIPKDLLEKCDFESEGEA